MSDAMSYSSFIFFWLYVVLHHVILVLMFSGWFPCFGYSFLRGLCVYDELPIVGFDKIFCFARSASCLDFESEIQSRQLANILPSCEIQSEPA
ncbi:hypothetical protein BDA96_10G302600 [Sorghum bicolor]|uniref:Uncharacterized protein n=1 Tax=Sorghum bicolor TaxID=4558 RepID=A0A921Q5B7_SORBI|nr:hypothetical protein BDA96_10G302600 [Sorghum bicolor]